ncbi:MAG: TonB-dependent receptor [Bacteroidota bacterium]|nr:TonB-dependent receptor [Bacteroidota bacterium]
MSDLGRMLRVALASLVLICAASSATAQILRGFISDQATGEPLMGVNVALISNDGSLYGAATNLDGIYLVPRFPPGTYNLRITYIGYVTHLDTLTFAPQQTQVLDLAMDEATSRLGELVVEGDADDAMADVIAGLERIEPAAIERIPGPDVSGDLAAYIATLPGVILVGDQGGQFYVRGGEPTQNLVLLDGMLIYQPFHILSYYSAFPAEILRTVDLHAGGFGARYGGRISSVIEAWSRLGNNTGVAGSGSVSPFVAGAHAEGPITANGRFTFLASARQSLVERLAGPAINQSIPLQFGDQFAKLQGQISRNARLSVSGLHTYDRGRIGSETARGVPTEVRWTNDALGARYLFLPGNLPILAEFMASYSYHAMELGPSEAPLRASTTGRINMEANLVHYSRRGDMRWGMFARTLTLTSELGGLYQELDLETEYVTEAGIYAAPELQINSELSVSPGLRVHHFPSKSAFFWEPRFRAEWERGPDRVSVAAGLYHQEIVGINDRRDAASVFTAWAAVPIGSVPRAFHVLAGYNRVFREGWQASADVYFKRMKNLYIAEWTARPRLTSRLQQANGRVYGLDLRMEYRRPRLGLFANYGLASVQYRAMQPELLDWFGSADYSFRPAHDRRHQLNLTASLEYREFIINARWQLGSGRPFNQALGFDGFLLMDGSRDVFTEPGERRVIYERPFNGILPTYHRLDLSVERTMVAGPAHIAAQISVINLYDRANIFYLDVFTLQRADQLPLLPSLGIKVDLG